MPFLLAYPASTGVVPDPGPAGATFSFISAMPGGVTVRRSGSGTHINGSGFVVLDGVDQGRIDCDALIDGLPAGSSSKELTGVSALSVASAFSISSAGRLAGAIAAPSAGVLSVTVASASSSSFDLGPLLAIGAAGILKAGSIALTGTVATGSPGTFSVAVTGFVSIAGNAGTGSSGALTAASSTGSTLIGAAAIGGTNILSSSSSPPALSSLLAAGAAGGFGIVLTPGILAAVQAAGSSGVLSVSAVMPPSVLATGAIGIVTLQTARTLPAAVATSGIGNFVLAGGGFSSGFSSSFSTSGSSTTPTLDLSVASSSGTDLIILGVP